MENKNEETGLLAMLQNSGVDILDLPEQIKKIQSLLPLVKENLPKLKEMEAGFKFKDAKTGEKKPLVFNKGEILMYNVMITGHEVFLYVSAARQVIIDGKNETVIRVLHRFELIKEAEKAMSNLPNL